jgi:hypothetical protein
MALAHPENTLTSNRPAAIHRPDPKPAREASLAKQQEGTMAKKEKNAKLRKGKKLEKQKPLRDFGSISVSKPIDHASVSFTGT